MVQKISSGYDSVFNFKRWPWLYSDLGQTLALHIVLGYFKYAPSHFKITNISRVIERTRNTAMWGAINTKALIYQPLEEAMRVTQFLIFIVFVYITCKGYHRVHKNHMSNSQNVIRQTFKDGARFSAYIFHEIFLVEVLLLCNLQ